MSWPRYEMRIRYDERRDAWIPIEVTRLGGGLRRMKEDFMGYHQRPQAIQAAVARASWLSRGSPQWDTDSPLHPPHPHPVPVRDEQGICVTAFVAGQFVPCR